jgi:hypothetical protein
MNQDFIDIQDIEKMDGWKLYERKVKEEIEIAVNELRKIETEGRNLQDVGSDYIRLIERINTLYLALDIPNQIKEEGLRDN